MEKPFVRDPNIVVQGQWPWPAEGSVSNTDIIAYRKQHLGKSLSLQYKVPIKMVPGAGQLPNGPIWKEVLDTVNNVAHVGHEHPA